MKEESIESLLINSRRFLMWKALHIVGGDYHDAQDLVSETIILALTKKEEWGRQTCKFNSWIRWRMLDAAKYFRFGRHIPQPLIFLSDKFTAEIPPTALDDIEFMKLIEKLPFPAVAIMNEQGYFDREIAKKIGVSRPIVQRMQNSNREAYRNITWIEDDS